MVSTLPAGRGRWLSAALPGVVLVAGLGCVLGGAAGTADWPVVGTFFGAVAGSVVGAVVGVVLTLTLALLARVTRSSWAARLVSGLVAGLAGLGLVGLGSGTDAVRGTPAVVLLATGTVVAGALGPMIAFGVRPMPDGRPGFTWAAGVWGVCLGWGCALGAAAGAVTGLVIGLDHLPTLVFAGVEGGVLGCVSGLVLACLAAGIAVLPRLHPLP
jgi:hypothetical protein